MAAEHKIVTIYVDLKDHNHSLETAMIEADKKANEVISEHGGELRFAPTDSFIYSTEGSKYFVSRVVRTLVVQIHLI